MFNGCFIEFYYQILIMAELGGG